MRSRLSTKAPRLSVRSMRSMTRDRHAVSRRRAAWMCIGSGLASGMLVYLMDPERGRRRRNMLRDQFMARLRRVGRGVKALFRGAAAETYGVSHRIVHLVPKPSEMTDDETLRQRVESQLFRDRHVPKGNLNISAEHGMVILRGELDSPLEIAQLEERVRHMPGVRGIQNLLHPHGTPAPNKERSWAASSHPSA
jgi:BON domain